MVNVNTAISNIISTIKTSNPSFSGLAPNTGGLFGGAEVKDISSGATTTSIIQAGTLRTVPTFASQFPAIKTGFEASALNFANINESFKQIQNAFASLLQPAVNTPQTGAAGTVIGPQQTPSSDTTPKGSIQEQIEQVKAILGPAGITAAIVIGGLFLIKSLRS